MLMAEYLGGATWLRQVAAPLRFAVITAFCRVGKLRKSPQQRAISLHTFRWRVEVPVELKRSAKAADPATSGRRNDSKEEGRNCSLPYPPGSLSGEGSGVGRQQFCAFAGGNIL